MARSGSSLLRRFLRTVAPGTPGPAGVPADREAEAAEELAPVFAALADARDEADAVRAQGRRDADERRHAADDEASQLLADARGRAEAARADAAQATFGDVDRQRDQIDADTAAEIDAFAERSDPRRHELVTEVMDRVRQDLGLGAGEPASKEPASKEPAG